MVKYIAAEQLVGKEVVTNDGFDIGKFEDADINEVTGKLTNILVDPNPDSQFANKLDIKDGKLRLSYNAVIAVNDYIMIDRKQL